jgi:hypothetical protein
VHRHFWDGPAACGMGRHALSGRGRYCPYIGDPSWVTVHGVGAIRGAEIVRVPRSVAATMHASWSYGTVQRGNPSQAMGSVGHGGSRRTESGRTDLRCSCSGIRGIEVRGHRGVLEAALQRVRYGTRARSCRCCGRCSVQTAGPWCPLELQIRGRRWIFRPGPTNGRHTSCGRRSVPEPRGLACVSPCRPSAGTTSPSRERWGGSGEESSILTWARLR